MNFRSNLRGSIIMAGSLVLALTAAFVAACGGEVTDTSSPTNIPILTYELEVIVEPQASASYILNPIPDAEGNFKAGTTVTIDVIPKEGWRLERWVGPAYDVNGESAKVNMDSSHTIAVRMVRKEVIIPTATLVPTAPPAETVVVATLKTIPNPTSILAPSNTPTSTNAALGAIQRPSGLVSWWPGDGNTNDIVGDNDGALTGDATFAPGMVVQAFSFDVTGDSVLVPDSADLNITGDVTVELWAKRTGFGTREIMVAKGAASVDRVGVVPSVYSLRFVDNRLAADFGQADGSSVGLLGPVVTDSEFHHYAYVRGGNSHKLLMDGVIVAEDTFTGVPGDTSGIPLTIGLVHRDSDSMGFQSFGGIIDEATIFNRALTDAEIKAIYDAGSAGKIKPGALSDG